MSHDRSNDLATFRLAPSRYKGCVFSDSRAARRYGKPAPETADRFAQALNRLSAEDEEILNPEDQGPIVFRNGVFQIDVDKASSPVDIDPALKGLIDSILG